MDWQRKLLGNQKRRGVLEPKLIRGVSLNELLIGMAIIAILMAAGAPNLGHWLKNSEIRAAADSILNGLQLARVEAVKRNAKTQFELTDSTKSNWVVGCVRVKADCPESIQSYSSSEGTSKVKVEADQKKFVFNGLGKIEPLPVSDVNINVSNPAGGNCMADKGPTRCLRIAISKTGKIRMCDPSLAKDDPKGC